MSQNQQAAGESLPLEVTQQIDALCNEFRTAIRAGAGISLEGYVGRIDQRWRQSLLKELALVALYRLGISGSTDPRGELLAANKTVRDELANVISAEDVAITISLNDSQPSSRKSGGLIVRCPHCRSSVDLIVDASLMDIDCSTCGDRFSLVSDSCDTRDATAFARVAHFDLIERLGMGEFGTVWKARDTLLDRTVALKIPRREQIDPVSVEKFMREARAAAQLSHPNIVHTYEVGRDGKTFYIVHDYIRGVPLSALISDQPLGTRAAVLMVATIADALQHAHAAGIVHRDMKPSNILIDDNGEPHVMDFGLAKRSDREITITTEGAVLGTPAYMSPEQARGEGHQVDGRSDIYSLGVILFQLLTGELPFRGTTRMMLHKVINDEPPGPRTFDGRLPKDLDTICLKCMEKEPSRRYATAAALSEDLRRHLAGEVVFARRVGWPGRTLRWTKRNKAVAALLATTISTLLLAAVVSTFFAWNAKNNAAAVTNTLYDSIVQEIKLTREVRRQGYGNTVRRLIDDARNLPTPRVDKSELRRQLTLALGDFVAHPPSVIDTLPGDATSIRLGASGSELFVGLGSGRILIYDVGTGKKTVELDGFTGAVQTIAVSAADDQIVAADGTGEARVWLREGATWNVTPRIFRMGDRPHTVTSSPDGEQLAFLTGSNLQTWDVASGEKRYDLSTDPAWIMRNAAFDMQNRRLVAGFLNRDSDQAGWSLWNLDTGTQLHKKVLPGLGYTYSNSIAIGSQGERLAIGFDEALLVYEMQDFERTNLFRLDAIKAVAFSHSRYLAAMDIRGQIIIWNAVTNQPVAQLIHPQEEDSRQNLAFSADGTHLAASNAHSVRIWDLHKGAEKTTLAGHDGQVPCAAFHPNGKQLATGGKDQFVRFWDATTGRLVDSLQLPEAVQTLAFTSDGRFLAVGSMAGSDAPHLRLVDTKSNEIVYSGGQALGSVHSLAWCDGPDGRRLAACGSAGLALWKMLSDEPPRFETVVELKRPYCLATVLSPSGQWMIWAEGDQLHAWNVAAAAEKKLHAPSMRQGWHGLSFQPDGKSFVFVSKTGVGTVWNVDQDASATSIGEPGTFNAPQMAVSPDGAWLAALSESNAVTVWHVPTSEHVYSFRPEGSAVWSLAWGPASDQLAVGRTDGSVAIWHLPRIQDELARFGLEWTDRP